MRLMPDYVLPGVPNRALATILAGIAGALLVFITAASVSRLRRSKAAQALHTGQPGESH